MNIVKFLRRAFFIEHLQWLFLDIYIIFRSSRPEEFCKKVFLEISKDSQENTCARVSFLIKLQAACNFIKKETLAQVFSCEFCEISKNTYSYRTTLMAASAFSNIFFLLSSPIAIEGHAFSLLY